MEENFRRRISRQSASSRWAPVVGEEIQRSAIIASLLAMFGILFYVAFRYEFFLRRGRRRAVLHDVLFTIGATASPTPFPAASSTPRSSRRC
jgi:preprotein translocase subunit SecF